MARPPLTSCASSSPPRYDHLLYRTSIASCPVGAVPMQLFKQLPGRFSIANGASDSVDKQEWDGFLKATFILPVIIDKSAAATIFERGREGVEGLRDHAGWLRGIVYLKAVVHSARIPRGGSARH